MTALRQQAYDLLDKVPEKDLCLVVDILEAFNRNERGSRIIHVPQEVKENFVASRFGVAAGKFVAPDDIDAANDEIINLFEGNV